MDNNNKNDLIYLIFIIVPMFIIGLRFWTSPVYLKYDSTINAISVPFSIIVLFIGNHIDLKIMSVIVFLMNFYVFWYHSDPSFEDYS